jgi:hypothetical protein
MECQLLIEWSAEIDTNAGVIVSSSGFIGVVAVSCTTHTSLTGLKRAARK